MERPQPPKTPPQNDPPRYKEAQGYIGVIQEANSALKRREERKASEKLGLGQQNAAEQEPATSGLGAKFQWLGTVKFKKPAFLAVLDRQPYKRIAMWSARLVIVGLILWQWRELSKEFNQDEIIPVEMPDVLITIEDNAPDYDGVKNYVNYIAAKAAGGKLKGIEGKWVDGIPPTYKDEAKMALETLGQEFTIGRVSADKGVIYNVECTPKSEPKIQIVFEVVRKKIAETNKVIYRLQRVHQD